MASDKAGGAPTAPLAKWVVPALGTSALITSVEVAARVLVSKHGVSAPLFAQVQPPAVKTYNVILSVICTTLYIAVVVITYRKYPGARDSDFTAGGGAGADGHVRAGGASRGR
jgi:hypothetical protein